MKPMKKSIKVLSILCLFWAMATAAIAQNIHVYVVESQTGDSVSNANARYQKEKVTAVADASGHLTIKRINGSMLTVSSVGYKERKVKINQDTPDTITVVLLTDSRRLGEVVVKAKRRHKYTRKDNPAVELMKRVIAAKKRTHLENNDFYRYDKYQKLTFAINDLHPEELETGIYKKQPWLRDQVEMCEYNNKLILPVSVDETLTEHIYRKNPRDEKDIVKAQSTKGVNSLVQTGEALNTILKDVFQDIDLYDDQINLLQTRFPSPIGPTAIAFYHYYIDDTCYVDQDRCIRLQFMPANLQDFGFRGELYVLDDSTLHVRKCDMQLPAGTGVNYVEAMRIQLEFNKLQNGDWALTKDNMMVEIHVNKLISNAVIIRNTDLSNYSFESIENKLFRGKAKVKYDPNSKMKGEEYWAEHRAGELTKSEKNMGGFIKRLSQQRAVKWVVFGIKAFVENFIETGHDSIKSKIDIGPINTIVSKNYTDGIRLRASARTTASLNPHWFAEGFYAYGLDSKKHYYDAKVTYSFNKPNYQPLEFPMRKISLESTFDAMSFSDRNLIHNKDNIFMTFRPATVTKMFFYKRQTLAYTWETDYGLAIAAHLQRESNQPTGTLIYETMQGVQLPKVRFSEISLGLDYRPGQTFINSKQMRIEANFDAPQFLLKHTMGLNHFLGGQYKYNHTEMAAYKRLWLGSWGNFDMRLKAGAEWNKVPYFLLIMPPVNTSFFEHQGTFNLMEDMEFLNDRYVQFNLAWVMNGKIFNRIPLLRKLKWREYFAFKGMWGKLTDKNNPFLEQNANDPVLLKFPEGVRTMGKDPYLELVVGVHNIFKFLEIDYVRRLTYTNFPGIDKNGIRFGVNVVF